MKRLAEKPNILLIIADDQGWPHASAYGCELVHTPAFDRIAGEGILFNNAFCPAPQCAPSRASLLTGRNLWSNKEAGVHNGDFPPQLIPYTNVLREAGYFAGYTGKPWAPGNWEKQGLECNPAGAEYNTHLQAVPTMHISKKDYAENFKDFLNDCGENPFCFWFGSHEPHREYEEGSGIKSGKSIKSVTLPAYLPDDDEVKSDMLDYALEIEWFDSQIARFIKILEQRELLDNTLIVVTSDNGMPFPRAKANNYEHGIHIPFAARWGGIKNPGRIANEFVSLIDLAPTFLEAAGIVPLPCMSGKSLMNVFADERDLSRDCVITGMERHSVARCADAGYPMRSIRTEAYLYILNYHPERWPAGNPPLYADIDGSPSKRFIMRNKDNLQWYFNLSFGKRANEELYEIREDADMLRNLAYDDKYGAVKAHLRNRLEKALMEQGDPRMTGGGDIFDTYPHYGNMEQLKKLTE